MRKTSYTHKRAIKRTEHKGANEAHLNRIQVTRQGKKKKTIYKPQKTKKYQNEAGHNINEDLMRNKETLRVAILNGVTEKYIQINN